MTSDLWEQLAKAGQSKKARDRRGVPPGQEPYPGAGAKLTETGKNTRTGAPGARNCKHCGMLALRGRETCARHSGRGLANVERTPNVMMTRALQRLDRAGEVPADLANHPAWRAVRAGGIRLAPLARDLALSWTSGDAQAWTRALTQAKQEVSW